MDELDPKVGRRLASICRDEVKAASKADANFDGAAEGSMAHGETTARRKGAAETARTYWSSMAYKSAQLQLLAAADHLVGLADILSKSQAVLPIFSVTRASVEASSRAAWLIDSTVAPFERPIRGLAEALFSWNEEARLPQPVAPTDRAALIKRAVRDAKTLGVTLNSGRKVPKVAGTQARPSTTSLIEATLKDVAPSFGSVLFQFWSATSHATVYGLGQHLADRKGGGIEFHRDRRAVVTSVAAASLAYTFAQTQYLAVLGSDIRSWQTWVAESDERFRRIFDGARS